MGRRPVRGRPRGASSPAAGCWTRTPTRSRSSHGRWRGRTTSTTAATDGGQAELVAAAEPMAVTSRSLETAKLIVVLGLDAEQEVPVLHLRLRKAARARREDRRRAPAAHAAARRRGAHPAVARRDPRTRCGARRSGPGRGRPDARVRARRGRRHRPGRRGDRGRAARRRRRRRRPPRPRGRRPLRLRHPPRGGPRVAPGRRAPRAPAGRPPVRPTPPSAPRSRPSGGRSWPREPGRDANGILHACAEGADRRAVRDRRRPAARPPRRRARPPRAARTCPTVVVQGLELGDLAPFASAFLPAAAGDRARRPPHHVGGPRASACGRSARPWGSGRPDWEIFASLALAMGGDLGVETPRGPARGDGPAARARARSRSTRPAPLEARR